MLTIAVFELMQFYHATETGNVTSAVSACTAGPLPGFSSRGGQKPDGRTQIQKGGGTFLKYSIGCMQQPGSQT